MSQPERLSDGPPESVPGAQPAETSELSRETRLAMPARLPATLPLMLQVRESSPGAGARDLRLVEEGGPKAAGARKKERQSEAVLRGIKDLQQLQKQTIAVLESVKGALDDIHQVLRSPEATRGVEKQHNAAMLLAKGFAREAIEQAYGAVSLLPANPEAHLLLSLSLATDQQFDASLSAARKGLALFDRRAHPLAIEAGLLHALAALGCAQEAVEKWAAIIDGLPLPVLFENMARIAACFPAETDAEIDGIAPDCQNLLDDLICRRLARHDQHAGGEDPPRRSPRLGTIELRPDEIPPEMLLAALDAAHDHDLSNTHRAILGQIARRLQLVRPDPRGAGADAAGETSHSGSGGVIRFINECLIPLGNRGLDKSTEALGRAAFKRLLSFRADAMTLHRAMTRLQMAGAGSAAGELANLLQQWRRAGNQGHRRGSLMSMALLLVAAGASGLLWGLYNLGAFSGRVQTAPPASQPVLLVGAALMVIGIMGCFAVLLPRRVALVLPHGRPPLSSKERIFLNTGEVRRSVKSAVGGR